ncbi:MAG: hypothetical protein A2Y56_05430 [Candidatus Aminicenantes bacterium RBG_13_63_10]|nr:MAG: hypothetical protein A2Y56_05430 [Candidatus Aminicenantes bacterium RBG_13_63_10]
MKRTSGRQALALGFCLLTFLALPVSPAQSRNRLRVTAEIANIRQKPDIGSVILIQVPRETTMAAVSREGDWYLVSLVAEDGRTISGYVHISLVSETAPGPAAETPVKVKPADPPRSSIPSPPPVSVYLPETKFALAFMGGGNYVLAGDLNAAVKGQADYLSDQLGVKGTPAVSPVHLGYVFGGEFFVPLAGRLSLGFGLEYLKSQKQSIVLYQKGANSNIYTALPEVHALPVRIFISYSPVQALYMFLGLEYYFASCSYSYRTETGLSWREVSGTATGHGLGAMAGLGLEWNIVPSLAFVIEAVGRYAPLSGFRGEGSLTDSLGAETLETGKLYYYELQFLGGTSFPALMVRSKLPTEAGVFSPREAEIDFTGFSVKAGLKVRF